jgi:hypothetical protein
MDRTLGSPEDDWEGPILASGHRMHGVPEFASSRRGRAGDRVGNHPSQRGSAATATPKR